MYTLDTITGALTLPVGDTMTLPVTVTDSAGQFDGETITATFLIHDRTKGATVISKTETVVDGAATFTLASADTAELSPAHTYVWSTGITTSGGQVITAVNKWLPFSLTPNGIARGN